MKLFRSLFAGPIGAVNLLKTALVLLLVLSMAEPAAAQYAPQSAVYTVPSQMRTFAATKVALAPAASATDFFTIRGSASTPVRVRRISCSGTSTAAATALVQVVKRSAVNTGGTSAASTAVAYNSTPGIAATATVLSYTANPSALGTAVGPIAAGNLTTNTLATSAVLAPTLVFDFSNQFVFLNGAAEVLALNANAASFTAGASLSCSVEWSEG